VSVVLMWSTPKFVFLVLVILTCPAPIIIGIGYIKPADTKKFPINKPIQKIGPAHSQTVFDLDQWRREEARAEAARIQVKFSRVFIQFSPHSHPNSPHPTPTPTPRGSIVWQGKSLSFLFHFSSYYLIWFHYSLLIYNVPLKFGSIIVPCPRNLIKKD
jgi:hypothetical protein